jgi:hypothetical protein
MWQDPAWQNVILERPEVWGVQEVTSDSVLMRVIARTGPLRQWEVGRELRERIKTALAPVSGTGPSPLPEGTPGPDAHPPDAPQPGEPGPAVPPPVTGGPDPA